MGDDDNLYHVTADVRECHGLPAMPRQAAGGEDYKRCHHSLTLYRWMWKAWSTTFCRFELCIIQNNGEFCIQNAFYVANETTVMAIREGKSGRVDRRTQ